MDEAQNYQRTILGCDALDDPQAATGTRVRCAFDFHAIRSEAMGFAPFTDNYWDLTITDDKVVAGSDTLAFMENGFSLLVWEPFARWVSSTYPDDAAAMYTDATHSTRAVSEESVELWDRRSREYVDSRVGFVGLPPEGTTSNNPAAPYEDSWGMWWCEPAIQVADCQRGSRLAAPGWNELSIFPDGRVIWWFQGDLPEGINPLFTGLLEQLLTPQGVEYFRTEFAQLEMAEPGPPANYDGLVERLRDPSDWPAGTWADPQIRAYVPATYEVRFSRSGRDLDEEVLTLLPEAAQDLLRGRTWWDNATATTAFLGAGSIGTDDIRTLVDTLDDAGVEQDPEANAYALQ
jgi:hypothetical protein